MNSLSAIINKKKQEMVKPQTGWVKQGDVKKQMEEKYMQEIEKQKVVQEEQIPILEVVKKESKQKKPVIIPEEEKKPEKILLEIGNQNLDSVLLEFDDKKNIQDQSLKHNKNQKKYEEALRQKPKDEKQRLVYLWCKKMMEQWENELEKKIESKASDVKLEKNVYKSCQENIKPLIKSLKKTGPETEILDSLYVLVSYCMLKEYVRANDIYMQLCIGNSPWPMGVTMVGIHERSGRSKIYTSQVAHILNNETQRKYLQSVKRLISVCQKFYPTDPSKSMVA